MLIRKAVWVLGILSLGGSSAAHAKHIYEYTDAQGIRHFTDVKPGDDVGAKSTLVRTDPQPLIHLREDGTDADRTLVFVNSAGGAVSVDVSIDEAANVQTEPALPARIVLAGLSETRALRIYAVNPANGFRYRFKYRYMPGDFRASHDANARYGLPFPADRRFRIDQAFGGRFSHGEPQSFFAVDIAMPQGTPILAARAGIVMTVDNDFFGTGLDMARYADRANNIRIMHDDGTMAVYAHLQLEGAIVHVGQHVRAGQQLGLSGDTGFASGPHLHFCVQRNADMSLISVPFEFANASGGFTPTEGMLLGGYQ